MTALKLTQIGNSVGVILPKEVLARLKVAKGDTVFVTDAANGVLLTPVTGDALAHALTTGELPDVARPFTPRRFRTAVLTELPA